MMRSITAFLVLQLVSNLCLAQTTNDRTLADLTSTQAEVRIAALRRLAKLPADPRMTQPMLSALQDESKLVRLEAARTCGVVAERFDRAFSRRVDQPDKEGRLRKELEDEWQRWQLCLVDSLCKSISDPDQAVGNEAMRSLALICCPVEEVVPPYGRCGTGDELLLWIKADKGFSEAVRDRLESLWSLLDDREAQVVFSAAWMLKSNHADRLTLYMLRFLTDERWQCRGMAAHLLPEMLKEHPTGLLILLLSDTEERVRETAIMELKNRDKVLAQLSPHFAQSSTPLKLSIVELIRWSKSEAPAHTIALAAEDLDGEVRRKGFRLAAINDVQLPSETLKNGLQDGDPRIREYASSVLARQHGADAAPVLFRMLSDRDKNVRDTVLRELCSLKDPVLLGTILAALRKTEDDWITGIDGVFHAAGPAAAPLVRKLSRDREWRFRAMALIVAIDVVGEGAKDIAKRALKDSNHRVRESACQVFGDLAVAEAIDILTPMLNDPDRDVRSSAILALGNIKSPRIVGLIEPFSKDKEYLIASAAKDALECQRSGSAGRKRVTYFEYLSSPNDGSLVQP